MPKAVKILLWIGAFLACAGVGAYVAAHTDPFPPGVDDPGAHAAGPVSTEVPTSPPGPAPSFGAVVCVVVSVGPDKAQCLLRR